MAPPRPGWLRGLLARIAAAAGLTALFFASGAAGLALHLDTAPARGVIRRALNGALRDGFRGDVEVGRIDLLGLRGVEVGAVVARAPGGEPVLRVTGIRASLDAIAIARGLLRGDPGVTVQRLRIDHVEVVLDGAPGGALLIAEAFAPAPGPPGPPGPLRLALPRIEIDSLWLHGEPAPGRAVDATVSDLVGSTELGPERSRVEIERADVVERRLLTGLGVAAPSGAAAAAIEARVEGRLEADEGRPLAVTASISGHATGVALSARASLRGHAIEAAVEVPALAPGAARALWPDLPLERPIALSLEAAGALPEVDLVARVAVLPPAGAAGPPGGELLLRGHVALRAPLRATAEVSACGVDPRAFAAAAPAARVHASARAALEGGRLEATATIQAAGAAIDAALTASTDEVRLEAAGRIPSLAALPRLPPGIRGSADVRLAGALRGGAIAAQLDARVTALRVGGDLRLGRGRLRVELRGPRDALERPGGALQIVASLRGDRLVAGGHAFELIAADAAGPIGGLEATATLSGGPLRIAAAGLVNAERAEARRIHLEIHHGDDRVEGRIDRVAPRGDDLDLEGFALERAGVGRLEAALSLRPGQVRVRSGRLELFGEALTIGPGWIRSRGESAASGLDASLTWEAPDGGRVRLDYAGALWPLLTGELRLGADAPRPARGRALAWSLLEDAFLQGALGAIARDEPWIAALRRDEAAPRRAW